MEELTYTPHFVKFNLNEKLNITLIGRKNIDVQLVFRFE
jgi:hypothetical protein